VRYAVEMTSDAMTCIPSFTRICSGIQATSSIFIIGSCILLRVLSNYKMKPSFPTTDKMYLFLCSLQSRHVSALTSGHLQVVLVILNIKIEVRRIT
jgi:hypothetical protein